MRRPVASSPRSSRPARCRATDNSAWYGYAARSAELPATLPVAGVVAAARFDVPALPRAPRCGSFTGARCRRRGHRGDPGGRHARRGSRPVAGGGRSATTCGRPARTSAIGDTGSPPARGLASWDIGLLAALGVVSVPVARAPRVALIATADELVDVAVPPGPGQLVDSSVHALAGPSPRLVGSRRGWASRATTAPAPADRASDETAGHLSDGSRLPSGGVDVIAIPPDRRRRPVADYRACVSRRHRPAREPVASDAGCRARCPAASRSHQPRRRGPPAHDPRSRPAWPGRAAPRHRPAVAGGDQRHARARATGTENHPSAAEQADVPAREPRAGGDHGIGRSRRPRRSAARWVAGPAPPAPDAIPVARGVLLDHQVSAPGGIGAPVKIRSAAPRGSAGTSTWPRRDPPATGSVAGSSAERAGVAIHRRVVVARQAGGSRR